MGKCSVKVMEWISSLIKPNMSPERRIKALDHGWLDHVRATEMAVYDQLIAKQVNFLAPQTYDITDNISGQEVDIVAHAYSKKARALRHGISWRSEDGQLFTVENLLLPEGVRTMNGNISCRQGTSPSASLLLYYH